MTTSNHPYPPFLAGFGFDPTHVVDLRVEMASDSDTLPADWPCEIVRRAAKVLNARASWATKGPWTASPVYSSHSDVTSGVYSLAHLHESELTPGYVVQDEREHTRDDWTATLKAALAYLREDAPKAVRSDG